MRTRIKELAIQASAEQVATCPDGTLNQYVTPEMQKFAELIIRECMVVIKQNENASLTASNFTDEKKQGIQLGLEFAITDIAEHFGVEE